MIGNPKLSISWLFLLLGILGYFGVSDADAVLRNHPFGYPPNNNNNKVDADLREKERLLDQVVINALANPSEWVHLRQLFERVDEEISRTKGGANNNVSSPSSPSSPSSSSSGTSGMNELIRSSSSSWSEKSMNLKPKFSYHRVIEGSRKGRPFAAVTLMDTEPIPSEDGIVSEERISLSKMGHDHHEARHHRNHHSHQHQRNEGNLHTHRNNHHHQHHHHHHH